MVLLGSALLPLPFYKGLALIAKGPFNNYVDKMSGGGGQNMSVFFHTQGIKDTLKFEETRLSRNNQKVLSIALDEFLLSRDTIES